MIDLEKYMNVQKQAIFTADELSHLNDLPNLILEKRSTPELNDLHGFSVNDIKLSANAFNLASKNSSNRVIKFVANENNEVVGIGQKYWNGSFYNSSESWAFHNHNEEPAKIIGGLLSVDISDMFPSS